VLDGRTAPVVQVVRQTTSTNFEKHTSIFSDKGLVCEDVYHVEHIVIHGLGVGHHAFEDSLLTVRVSILNDVVKAVRCVDVLVSRSDSVTELVLETNILRGSSFESLLLLRSVRLELEAGGGEGVERAEVSDIHLFILNDERVDNTFLGE
jgi:hypothetical protein